MKGITPKIRMLCFVLINSVLFNLLCVWILFYNASSRSCFRSIAWNVDLIRPFYRPVRKTENLDFWKPVDNLKHFSGGISVCLRVKSSTHIRYFSRRSCRDSNPSAVSTKRHSGSSPECKASTHIRCFSRRSYRDSNPRS